MAKSRATEKIKKVQNTSQPDLAGIKKALDAAESQIRLAKRLLFQNLYGEKASVLSAEPGKVIEGIFNGEGMVGADGKVYAVPPNYASKSKLVAGDELKLSISDEGDYTFKLIKPIPRIRVMGRLTQADGKFFVKNEGQNYRVLAASVSYFKAQIGEKIAVSIPKTGICEWAAMENIISEK